MGNTLLFHSQVELWGEATSSIVGCVETTSVNGNLVFGVTREDEGYLTISRRNKGVRHWVTVTQRRCFPLVLVVLSVGPNLLLL